MKTADEMLEFMKLHKLGSGVISANEKRHFKVLAKQLKPNEDIDVCFMGLHNYKSMSNHNGYWAYGITKDKIIMAQNRVIGEHVLVVSLRNINDVFMKTGIVWGTLTIDTRDEIFNIAIDKNSIRNIHEMVTSKLFEYTENLHKNVVDGANPTNSAVDELIKWKNLMDQGIITEEEFERKKFEIMK